MDATKFFAGFIRASDLTDGPIEEKIVRVYEETKYGKLVLEFESGDSLSLNKPNGRALIKAYSEDTARWIGHAVSLEIGHWTELRH